MKVISARIPDPLFVACQRFCDDNGINTNKLIGQAIQAAIRGKVKLKPIAGEDICPKCGHTVHVVSVDSKLYFACFQCDWAGYLGEYTLPEEIEDLKGELPKEG